MKYVLSVFVLLVALLVPLGIAEPYSAQIVLRDADGIEYGTIDLMPVTTSAGETAYWFNLFSLNEQTAPLLQSGNSVIRSYNTETGEQLPDVIIPGDAGVGILYEGETVHRSDIQDMWNETLHFPVLSTYLEVPGETSEIDGILGQLGFQTQEEIPGGEPAGEETPEEQPDDVPEETPYEEPEYQPVEEPEPQVIQQPVPDQNQYEYQEQITESDQNDWQNPVQEQPQQQNDWQEPVQEEIQEQPQQQDGWQYPVQEQIEEQPQQQNEPIQQVWNETPAENLEIQEQVPLEQDQIEVPLYMVPIYDFVEMSSFPGGEVLGYTGSSDVLYGLDYIRDDEGSIWYYAYSVLNDIQGYIHADEVIAIEEEEADALIQSIVTMRQQQEQQQQIPDMTEEVTNDTQETETKTPETSQEIPSETQEHVASQIAAETDNPTFSDSDGLSEMNEISETIESPEITAIPQELYTVENTPVPELTQAPDNAGMMFSGYAVTQNKTNESNVRDNINGGKVIRTLPNGVLVQIGSAMTDDKGELWYAVTILPDGGQGVMRDFLLQMLTVDEARPYLEALGVSLPETTQEPAPEQTEGQLTEQMPGTDVSESTETEDGSGTNPNTQTPDLGTFPRWGYTIEQGNGISIVLRQAPNGEIPQTGAVSVITHVTPVQINSAAPDEYGILWYLITDLNTGAEGYIEASKVVEVSQEAALEGVIVPEVTAIPPVETPTAVPTATPEPTATPTPTPSPTPDPGEEQVLTEGDIYHYGYNTGTQVNVRKKADKNAGVVTKLQKGTIIWVMEQVKGSDKADWCYVRTESGAEGYMKAEFVQLMRTNEEQMYIASLDDPEVAPERTPTPEPTAESTQEPEVTPTATPELTPTPTPEVTPTPEPTDTPTPEPTFTPTPTPTMDPGEEQTLAYGGIYHYGYSTGSQVNIRKAANRNAGVVTKLQKGDIIWVMEQVKGSDGETWCLVRNESGAEGYMKAEFAKLMTTNEEAAYIASLDDPEIAPVFTATPSPEPTEVPTPTPTLEPTPTLTPEPTATPTLSPVPTSTPAPVDINAYARVISGGTPLRGNPDTNAYLQNILDAETVVHLFQSQYSSDGMTWYLAQYNGQWGYIRADLVRVMGQQETTDYLNSLETAMATPTVMPQATPEPYSVNATSAYAKLVKDSVNLRLTPSSNGTSLGRIPVNTLLLVTGTETDGTYTWYQVNYNGKDGYVRSDMTQMLTIAQLQDYLAEQKAKAQTSSGTYTTGTSTSTTGTGTTSGNSSNNVSYTIQGTTLQDLLPVDDSWTKNNGGGSTTANPSASPSADVAATPTPEPPAQHAALISSQGNMTVNNVPAITQTGKFTIYGTTNAYTEVTATALYETVTTQNGRVIRMEIIPQAVAETGNTVTKTVGRAVSDAKGAFAMDITLPQTGPLTLEITSGTSYARYSMNYDDGATPEPTAQPLPTVEPVQEKRGPGALPIILIVLAVIGAAGAYGFYIWRKKTDEEDELEEDEDDIKEEKALREQHLQRTRAQSASIQGASLRQPNIRSTEIPAFMRNTEGATQSAQAEKAESKEPQKSKEEQPSKEQPPKEAKAPDDANAQTSVYARQGDNPYARQPEMPVKPVAPVPPTPPTPPRAPDTAQTGTTGQEATETGSTPRRRRRTE